MGYLILIVSGKGGIGKIIIIFNFLVVFGKMGYKVFVVDVDFIMVNFSFVMGIDDVEIMIYDVFVGEVDIKDVIYLMSYENVDLILVVVDWEYVFKVDLRRFFLMIKLLKLEYDFVLIDCLVGF